MNAKVAANGGLILAPKAYSLAILICGGLVTLLCGFVGWHLAGYGLGDALYRAFMAFQGSDFYLDPPNVWISIARWLGLVTLVSTILGLLFAFSMGLLSELRIRVRSGHVVVIGVDDFPVSYALAHAVPARRVTLVDTQQRLSDYRGRDAAKRMLKAAVDFLDDDALITALGRKPRLMIFGDTTPSRNLERAKRVLEFRPGTTIVVRSDDQSLNADIGLWSPDFNTVPVIGNNLFSARALVTDVSPLDLARTRGQGRPHVAIIGVNDMALTLVEELALRCHAPDLQPMQITLFDKEPEAAARKIDMARPGLARAVNLVGPLNFDGLACTFNAGDRAILEEAAEALDLTALVVCTGDETRNMEIALRLRRLQLGGPGNLSAPILMEAQSGSTVAPEPVTGLTGGIYAFGGKMVRSTDITLEELQLTLGKRLHQIWCKDAPNAQPWEKLDQAGVRTNTRAALHLVETLQTLGFAPPANNMTTPIAVLPTQIDSVLADPGLIEDLARTEHQRWVAERFAEGWVHAPDRCDGKNITRLWCPRAGSKGSKSRNARTATT